jgi:hypothetical protein
MHSREEHGGVASSRPGARGATASHLLGYWQRASAAPHAYGMNDPLAFDPSSSAAEELILMDGGEDADAVEAEADYYDDGSRAEVSPYRTSGMDQGSSPRIHGGGAGTERLGPVEYRTGQSPPRFHSADASPRPSSFHADEAGTYRPVSTRSGISSDFMSGSQPPPAQLSPTAAPNVNQMGAADPFAMVRLIQSKCNDAVHVLHQKAAQWKAKAISLEAELGKLEKENRTLRAHLAESVAQRAETEEQWQSMLESHQRAMDLLQRRLDSAELSNQKLRLALAESTQSVAGGPGGTTTPVKASSSPKANSKPDEPGVSRCEPSHSPPRVLASEEELNSNEAPDAQREELGEGPDSGLGLLPTGTPSRSGRPSAFAMRRSLSAGAAPRRSGILYPHLTPPLLPLSVVDRVPPLIGEQSELLPTQPIVPPPNPVSTTSAPHDAPPKKATKGKENQAVVSHAAKSATAAKGGSEPSKKVLVPPREGKGGEKTGGAPKKSSGALPTAGASTASAKPRAPSGRPYERRTGLEGTKPKSTAAEPSKEVEEERVTPEEMTALQRMADEKSEDGATMGMELPTPGRVKNEEKAKARVAPPTHSEKPQKGERGTAAPTKLVSKPTPRREEQKGEKRSGAAEGKPVVAPRKSIPPLLPSSGKQQLHQAAPPSRESARDRHTKSTKAVGVLLRPGQQPKPLTTHHHVNTHTNEDEGSECSSGRNDEWPCSSASDADEKGSINADSREREETLLRAQQMLSAMDALLRRSEAKTAEFDAIERELHDLAHPSD